MDKQQKFSVSREYKLFFDEYYPNLEPNIKNNCLSLLQNPSSIYKCIPKDFIITTRNSSSKFNKDFLKETSVTISNYLEDNQNKLIYHLDIEDPTNVLGKFEQLYQGQIIIFKKEDIPTCHKITKLLFITCCPNFMKPEILWCDKNNKNLNCINVKVHMRGLTNFLDDTSFNTFLISTKKLTYKCNIFSVYLSDIIRAKLEENPKNNHFFYNFDDDFNEFQLICDLFNLKPINITRSKIDSIAEIVEDLKITCLLDDMNNFINKSEKTTQKIDDNQEIFNSINELFDWLYNIKEQTVKTVKNLILQSIWIETEENIQELVAFLLEVISTDILLHPYIFELITELNEQQNEFNHLEILLPFITQKLIDFLINDEILCKSNSIHKESQIFNSNQYIYAFIYKFYKNGIIQKNKLIEILQNYDFKNEYINLWFLPLLAEMDEKNINYIIISNSDNFNENINEFILSYLPNEMNAYEKMLDAGEPDDLLIKSLQNDDVDTVQRLISPIISESKKKKITIHFSIFDFFLFRNKNILNYAAIYGSLKCFKYLLLNYYDIDDETFELAVYGGNIEIIKIADQKIKNNKYEKQNDIIYAIRKHQNDLFDWLIEKIPNEYLKMDNIAIESAIHGNAHCLTEIIDRGFDLTDEIYTKIIQNASKKGFFRYIKFFMEIINGRNNSIIKKNDEFNLSSVFFGNLSIFKLFINVFLHDVLKQGIIIKHICFAVKNNYQSIINYYLDEIIKKESKRSSSINKILEASIQRNVENSFHSLLQKVYSMDLKFKIKFGNLLLKSVDYKNFEAVKEITDIILKKKPYFNFSEGFSEGASLGLNEICQYFINKKVKINYDSFVDKCSKFGLLNKNIYSIILSQINPELKPRFLFSIKHAIENKNYELVDYLFQENAKCDDALYLSVCKDDIDLVNIVLKYQNDLDLINKVWENGTALIKAVHNNNLQIVKRLLSIPGINPNIYYKSKTIIYPLTIAINNENIDIINAILDFYGDNIQYQNLQLEKAMNIIFNIYTNIKENDNFLTVIHRFLEIKCINPNKLYVSHKKIIKHKNNKLMKKKKNDDNEEEEINEEEEYIVKCHKSKDLKNKKNHISQIIVQFFKKVKKHDNEETINDNKKSTNYIINDVDNFISEITTYLDMDYTEKNDDDNNLQNVYGYEKNKDNISTNIQKIGSINTFLLCACARNDIDMVKKLLNLDQIDVNQYSFSNGDTALITAIKNKNISIAKLLIDHPKTNINQRTFYNETALSIAVYKELFKIANILLTNERFHPEDNMMKYIYYNSNYDFKKEILSSIHINLTDKDLSEIFQKAVKKKDDALIDLIFHKHFNDKNKISVNDINFAIKENSFNVFKRLIKLKDDNVNLHDFNNTSLLVNAVSISNENVINYILNNEKFDSTKSNIVEAFIKTYTNTKFKKIHDIQMEIDKYKIINKDILFNLIESKILNMINLMIKLYKYDMKHDHLIDLTKLLPNGKSYFASYSCYFNGIEHIFDFLMKNGINSNIPDSDQLYQPEMTIRNNSHELVKYLINTNIIDFSVKIPKKTVYEVEEYEEEEEEYEDDDEYEEEEEEYEE